MKPAIICFAIGLAAGIFIGVVIVAPAPVPAVMAEGGEGRQEAAAQPAVGPAGQQIVHRTATATATPDATVEATVVRRAGDGNKERRGDELSGYVRRLEDALVRNGLTIPPLNAVDLGDQIADLHHVAEEAIADRASERAAEALRHLRELGPEAYPALVELLNRINSARGSADAIDISFRDYVRILGQDREFLRYLVQDGTANQELRVGAIRTLNWLGDDNAGALFSDVLAMESDEAVVSALARSIGRRRDAAAVDAIAVALSNSELSTTTRQALLFSLARIGTNESVLTLEYFHEETEDAGLRAIAERAMIIAHPPVNGFAVMSVADQATGAKAGIEAGDIITRVNGKSIGNRHDLYRMLRNPEAGETTILLEFHRDGKLQELSVSPGWLGVRGDVVKAKELNP